MAKLSPHETKAWHKLKQERDRIEKLHIKELFEEDPDRFHKFSIKFENILLDFSKNRIDEESIDWLLNLAREMKLIDSVEAMFNGEAINETEGRAVLHTALRNRSNDPVYVDGENVMPEVNDVLAQMKRLVDQLHDGTWKGYSGKPIKNIVNIGIGGSHLGPEMATTALKPYWKNGIEVYYIANVDGTDTAETLKNLSPEETLFIIASKSFTTQETLTNAHTARQWFLDNGGNEDQIANHFVAISTNIEKAKEFGIAEHNVFRFWDWVGGRFSLWSAIGLPIAATIGFEDFERLLAGAHSMDQHFKNASFKRNIPVILGLLSIWYTNFFDAEAEAVLPYDEYLAKFPDHLQQLTMESNGKNIDRRGYQFNYGTQPIVFGGAGTNSQHSFFQLLHQGTRMVPCDFIAPVHSHHDMPDHHHKLLANFFAQPEALMRGKSREEVHREMQEAGKSEEEIRKLTPFKVFEGNRPSNSILIEKLTPYNLGALTALYEHKTFVQGLIWNIYSFDQWGVELGKELAKKILPELQNKNKVSGHDASTNGLINYFKGFM